MSKGNENLNGTENSALNIADVMPRFFLDERVGCIAIRDSHHPDFDVEHQGLDSELPDVVGFEMGKLVNNEWVVPEDVTNSFREKCRILNVHHNINITETNDFKRTKKRVKKYDDSK